MNLYDVLSVSTGSLSIVVNAESDIFLGNVHCIGNEAMLTDCSHSTEISCPRAELAGVRCEGMPLLEPTITVTVYIYIYNYM